MEIQLLLKLSTAYRTAIVVVAGVVAYVCCGLTGIHSIFGSIVVAALVFWLFHPVLNLHRPVRMIGLLCLLAFLFASSMGAFGTVQGFKNGFWQGYQSANNNAKG